MAGSTPEGGLHLLRRHLPGCDPAGGEQEPLCPSVLWHARYQGHCHIHQDRKATIEVETWTNCEGKIAVSILDAGGNTVLSGAGKDCRLVLNHPRLWDGVKDPYLYTAVATLSVDGQPVDEVRTRFCVRSFCVDPRNRKLYSLVLSCTNRSKTIVGKIPLFVFYG